MKNRDQMRMSNDNLDWLLDTGLSTYGAIEPRVGLEDRILANLRTEERPVLQHAWWKWGVLAFAAIVVIAVGSGFRSISKPRPVIGQQPATRRSMKNPELQVANHESTAVPKPAVRRTHTHPAAPVIAAASPAAPKLDQFPSPLPLTEEEKVLVGYVERYPQHAALLAEARMDSLRQDAEERRQIEMKDQRTTQ